MTTRSKLDEIIETNSFRYGSISYFKSDDVVGRSLREYGEWAQHEIDFLFDFIKPGDTVIDAGAFIGTHTLAFAHRIGQAGLVYAFEPQPLTFDVLNLNINQNSLSNVKIFNAALSNVELTIYIEDIPSNMISNPGGLSLPITLSEDRLEQNSYSPIQMTQLDNYNLTKCNLIKIDVEGMELNVIQGGRELLHKFRPLVFAECISVENGSNLISFMRDEKYTGFLHNELAYNSDNFRGNNYDIFEGARETNIIFVPNENINEFRIRASKTHKLIPLTKLDDLVLGILLKPQYKYEVLAKTEAAQTIGYEFLLNSTETEQLLDRESKKEQTIETLSLKEIELRDQLNSTNQQLNASNQQLNDIQISKAWRLALFLRKIRVKFFSQRNLGIRLIKKLISIPLEFQRAPKIRRDIALLCSSELFDEGWYLDQNPDVAQAKVDPARHYLLHGGFEGRDPSPLFNSSWYLNTYYDARKAHINPLVHYLKEGIKDKRPASPQMVFKKDTLDRESEPSAEPSPNILSSSAELTEHLNREKKFDKYVISISHDNYLSVNGGVQVAVGNQQRMMNEASISYLHIYPYKYQQTLTNYDDSFLVGISLDGKDIGIVKIQALLQAIQQADPAKIEDIHIHHTMGMSIKAIEQILAFGHHRGKFWLHDYFSLCPSKHLMRNDVSFCGAPDISSNSCVVCKYGEDRMRQNGEFLSLFKNNELEVIAPSEFTLDFWMEKFPHKQITGRVFPLAKLKEIEKRPARERAGELRLAFLGAPSDHKGWQTWLKIVELFSEKPNYYFFHFSSYPGTSGNYQWIRTTVTKNVPDAMINGLKDKNIDIAILWSITAETYSFTLLEALAAGCFVITNTISGNIQFYIGNHPNLGIVLANDNELIELLESNKLEGIIAGYQKGGIPQALLVNNDSRDY